MDKDEIILELINTLQSTRSCMLKAHNVMAMNMEFYKDAKDCEYAINKIDEIFCRIAPFEATFNKHHKDYIPAVKQ